MHLCRVLNHGMLHVAVIMYILQLRHDKFNPMAKVGLYYTGLTFVIMGTMLHKCDTKSKFPKTQKI